MSDFLSNFTPDNYKHTVQAKKKVKDEEKIDSSDTIPTSNAVEEPTEQEEQQEIRSEETTSQLESKRQRLKEKRMRTKKRLKEQTLAEAPIKTDVVTGKEVNEVDEPESEERPNEELTETDPTYKKKQVKKWSIIGTISLIVILLLFWAYYSWSHVKVPNFANKSISDVRVWAEENKVKVEVNQEYSEKTDANLVMKQKPSKNETIQKGKSLLITASMGPDPETVLPLPDFAKMNEESAKQWVNEYKAENLAILTEYSDTVEKGKFVKQEFPNKEVKPETYRRKDTGMIYYSKGKETFEKNIAVPDFMNKPKSEVETWAKNNSIKVNYKESDSDKVPAGMVMAQSLAKDTKVAKKDEMDVTISQGKAVIVPNFGDYTPETAAGVEGLATVVKTRFSNEVPYGQLLSQSIPAGTRLVGEEPKSIEVVYSTGRPYLKSYKGQLEGDLPKLFFDDYRSKGANINYKTVYVDSPEEKGTVVDMSAYNQYVPMEYTVTIAISRGNK